MTGLDVIAPAVVFGAPLATVAILVLLGIRRRSRFSRRPRMPFQAWSADLGVHSVAGIAVCEEVLGALAQALRVHSEQLRPDDSFDAQLALAPAWVGLPNPLVKDFLDEVARILYRRGVRTWSRFCTRNKTLGDLLLSVEAALADDQTPRPHFGETAGG